MGETKMNHIEEDLNFNPHQKLRRLSEPKFQVITTLFWNFIIGGVIIAILSLGLEINLELNPDDLQAYPEFAIVIIFLNLIAVGLFPIIYTILDKENASWYGISRIGFERSLILGILIVGGYYTLSLLITGQLLGNLYPIEFNTNCAISRVRCIRFSISGIVYSVIGAITYGPIEVFFVIWLIFKLDRSFRVKIICSPRV